MKISPFTAVEFRLCNIPKQGIEIRPTNGERNKCCCSLGVKPLIHQSELGTYTKVALSRKKFLSLCSIVKTAQWNGLIQIDN
jgi:hypothetical protein